MVINKECLYSWEEIPGNDSERVTDFLKSNYDVDWVKTAIIAKTNNGKTIMITAGKNVISLNLYNGNTELNLIINNNITDNFIVKTENGKLNIYNKEYSLNGFLDEFEKKPLTIALIGVSGVGKSSTINTMFKTELKTSDTVPCTKEFQSIEFKLKFVEGQTEALPVKFKVIDAPGLGEDIASDQHYLEEYNKHLPECDVIIWILAARNRAVALDQMYLEKLESFYEKIVFGLNQVDLIEPMNWNEDFNMPSEEIKEKINIIVNDRSQKLQKIIGKEIQLIPYSVKKRYNLQELFTSIIMSCPKERAWIYNSLKNFDPSDWIPLDKREKLDIKSDIDIMASIRDIFGSFSLK